MPKLVTVIDQMSDLRNQHIEIKVDWHTMTVWVNGEHGCLLRAVKCKAIVIEAEKLGEIGLT